MAAPVVQDLGTLMAQLDPAYAGSRAIYNQQINAIPGQTDAAVAGLDQAKTNSFTDINRGANSKGLAFSGIPAEEQARYLGEKYLPAVTSLKQNAQTQQLTLQQALAQLEQDRYKTALGTQQKQQSDLTAWQQEQEKMAFQAQQAALDRQAQAARSSAGQTDLRIVKNKAGGWDVLENGQKSNTYDLNAYARATGANIVDLLANGDAKDRQAAAWYNQKIKKYGTADQAKYLDELKRDRGTAFYLGG